MARKKTQQKRSMKLDVGIMPTPERHQHDALELEETAQAGRHRVRVSTQSTLDRYRARNQIMDRQYQAGEQFAAHWHGAGKGQRTVGSYAERTQGGEESDNPHVAHNAREIAKALETLDRVGEEFSGVTIHVCGLGDSAGDWAAFNDRPRYEGLVILRLALNVLARHFGLMPMRRI